MKPDLRRLTPGELARAVVADELTVGQVVRELQRRERQRHEAAVSRVTFLAASQGRGDDE